MLLIFLSNPNFSFNNSPFGVIVCTGGDAEGAIGISLNVLNPSVSFYR